MTAIITAAALVALAAAIATGLPRPWLSRRRSKEIREDVPILIEGLAAAMGAGLSLSVAFSEVAPTLRPELAAASRRAAASLALDVPISAAVAELGAVVPSDDVAPLGVILAAFARTGGRVATSLERLASLLRARIALDEERVALTAQSRASAAVLVALAPLGAGFLAIAMPDYLQPVVHVGLALLGLALAFEACGAVWLWRIVRATHESQDVATFLEAMVISLDAGLIFERALDGLVSRVPQASRVSRASRLLADLALGVPLSRALSAFTSTADEQRVAALIAASARFGSPLAHVLVVQADALRTSQRHRAQARARRLPVLMLFPLACCILPALLIVFLGPPLLSLLR